MPSVGGIPSVTEILASCGLTQNYGFLPQEKLDLARARGTALHLAIQWFHEGTLDETSLHPEIRLGFEAYRAFLEEERWVWEASELELFHPFGVVGHLDLIGVAPDVGLEILDLKFSDAPDVKGAARQLAMYGMLWDHNHPDRPHRRRRVLQITRDGHAKPIDVTNQHHSNVCAAAIVVYQERKADGTL